MDDSIQPLLEILENRMLLSADNMVALLGKPIDDFPNDVAHAAAITTASVNGVINYKGDVDCLLAAATVTGTMTVTMTPIASNGKRISPKLTLGDPLSYANAVSQSNMGQSVSVTFPVVTGHTYYARAESLASTVGAYTLSFKFTSSTPPSSGGGSGGGGGGSSGGTVTVNGPMTSVPTASPGASVIATVYQYTGAKVLLIAGTNGNDSLTISQTALGITVNTGGSTPQTFSGTFNTIVIYGFSGNDRIRTTNTVSSAVWISDGNGNDSIFNAATGTGTIQVGTGEDLIVSVGAGKATITTADQVGSSYWVDSVDTLVGVADSSVAMHKISAFYQPYSNSSSNPKYIPLTVAGQSLADPDVSGSGGYSYHNFSTSPLFTNGPQYNDIQQGQVGDCYFLSALASLAQNNPQVIWQSITPLGDGTYAIRFYNSNGAPAYLRVDADLPVTSGTDLSAAQASSTGEIWAPLLEKAWAFFRNGSNTYDSISGGRMSDAYKALTPSPTQDHDTDSMSAFGNFLTQNWKAGYAITMGSIEFPASPIVGGHAYMVQSVSTVGGVTYVTVYNPWGIDNQESTPWDNNPSDGLLKLTLAQVMTRFEYADVCLLSPIAAPNTWAAR